MEDKVFGGAGGFGQQRREGQLDAGGGAGIRHGVAGSDWGGRQVAGRGGGDDREVQAGGHAGVDADWG